MRRRTPLMSFACFFCAMLLTVSLARAASVTLDGTIRDFHGSFSSSSPFTPATNGHPHFEVFTVDPNNPLGPTRIPDGYGGIQGLLNQIGQVEPDIVGVNLGADGKPAWVGGSNANLFPTTKTRVNAAGTNLELEPDTITNGNNFNQWFNDTPNINQSTPFSLTLDDPDGDGVFTYQNDSFFPIDNQLFGNEGRAHNQHFTFEAHTTFTFRGGETFRFIGDDDVWVFINGERVIDLGGIHTQLTGEVLLNDLGLTEGNQYSFDFFFAERNTFESHFRIDTTIGSDNPPPPPPNGIPLPAAAVPGFIMLGSLGGFAGLKRWLTARRA